MSFERILKWLLTRIKVKRCLLYVFRPKLEVPYEETTVWLMIVKFLPTWISKRLFEIFTMLSTVYVLFT